MSKIADLLVRLEFLKTISNIYNRKHKYLSKGY